MAAVFNMTSVIPSPVAQTANAVSELLSNGDVLVPETVSQFGTGVS